MCATVSARQRAERRRGSPGAPRPTRPRTPAWPAPITMTSKCIGRQLVISRCRTLEDVPQHVVRRARRHVISSSACARVLQVGEHELLGVARLRRAPSRARGQRVARAARAARRAARSRSPACRAAAPSPASARTIAARRSSSPSPVSAETAIAPIASLAVVHAARQIALVRDDESRLRVRSSSRRSSSAESAVAIRSSTTSDQVGDCRAPAARARRLRARRRRPRRARRPCRPASPRGRRGRRARSAGRASCPARRVTIARSAPEQRVEQARLADVRPAGDHDRRALANQAAARARRASSAVDARATPPSSSRADARRGSMK